MLCYPDWEQDDGLIPDDTEADIADTLLRIRRKDPAIYKVCWDVWVNAFGG